MEQPNVVGAGRGVRVRAGRSVAALLAVIAMVTVLAPAIASPAGAVASNGNNITVAGAAVPSPIAGIAVTDRTATSLTVAWTDGPDGGSPISDHLVQWKDDTAGLDWQPVVHSAMTTATVTGLTSGHAYEIRVAAVNANGQGSWIPVGAASSVATSDSHTCEVTIDRHVDCWGANWGGMLGVPSSGDRPSPVRTSIANAAVVAVGTDFSCALILDGTAKCWGENGAGQLGDGTTTSRSEPAAVALRRPAVAIAAAQYTACAVLVDGTAQCWGSGLAGILGNGSMDTMTQASPGDVTGVSHATDIAMSGTTACVIVSNGAMKCWGLGTGGQIGDGAFSNRPTPVDVRGIGTTLPGARQISVGPFHTCAALVDGTARCWGANFAKQTGSSIVGFLLPTDRSVTLSNVVEVTTSYANTCARIGDGTVKCWGTDVGGTLGNGSAFGTVSATPVDVSGLAGAKTLASSSYGTCAIDGTSAVRCWGDGIRGRLGDGSTSKATIPTTLAEVASGVPSAPSSVAITNLTTTSMRVVWSAADGNGAAIDDYVVRVTGSSLQTNPTVTTTRVPITATGFDINGLVQGTLYGVDVWAENRNGAGAVRSASVAVGAAPGAISGLRVTSSGIGSIGLRWNDPRTDAETPIVDHAIQIKQGDGDWTDYTHDPIAGSTFTVTNLFPGVRTNVRVAAINAIGQGPWVDLGRATNVSVGGGSTCDVIADGSVDCWGLNTTGQLGDGTTETRTAPTAVVGLDLVRQVSVSSANANFGFACAVKWDGTVWCWGDNSYRELGAEGMQWSPVPVQVAGISNATQVAVGGAFACALLADGTVECWGAIGFFQQNNGSDTSVTPVVISGLNAASISAGSSHACAVGTDTNAYCFGDGRYGQIGNGAKNLTNGVSQVALGGAPVSVVAAGDIHSCAVLVSGAVKCWGSDGNGALGNGPGLTADQNLPSNVDLGTDTAIGIGAGYYSTCAVLTGGGLSCWGRNVSGQLGTGAGTNYNAPHKIVDSGRVAVDGGFSSTCFLDTSGSVWCAGDGTNGRLGNGATSDVNPISGMVTAAPAGVVVLGEPTNPTGLTATSATPSSVSLSWTAPTYDGGCTITDYAVWVRTTSTEWAKFDDGVSTSTTSTVTGLATRTAYAFMVNAVSSCAASRVSNAIIAATTGPPGAITEPFKILNLPTSMNLAWSAPADDGGDAIAGYEVDWSTDGQHWSNEPYSTETSRTITGLTAGTTYQVRIAAINHLGTGPFVTVSYTTAAPPAAPTDLYASDVTDTAVSLHWTAPTETDGAAITGYVVQYRVGQGAWSAESQTAIPGLSIWGFLGATTYEVRVAAVTANGTGAYVSAFVTTAGPPPAPTGLVTTAHTATSVALKWDAPHVTQGVTISDYKVEYRLGSGTWTNFTHTASTASTINVTGLTAGGSYQFRVTAVSNYGNSPASLSITQIAAVAPTAPTALAITARGKTQFSLSWTAPAGNFGAAITDYVVKISTDGTNFTVVNDGYSAVTSALIKNLSTGSHYWFKVQAVNSQGASAASNTIDGWASVPTGGLAAGPFVSSKTSTSVHLTWNPPLDSGGRPIINYVVQYAKVGAVAWTTVMHLASASNEIDVTGLTKAATYSFRVAPVTGDGQGAWSTINNIVVVGRPNAPTGLAMTAKTATSVSLKWTAPVENGGRAITDYVVEYKKSTETAWSTFNHAVSTGTTITVTGLTKNVAYQFRVSAKNSEGIGTASTLGTFTPSMFEVSGVGVGVVR